jgi:trimeric autotransporter adhesin
MTTPAGGLIGDATINVNANTTAAALALRGLTRDANGQLRDLRGRYVSESRLMGNAFNRAAGGGSLFAGALERLKGAAISLAPALIPIAVQAAPIAAGAGAAAVAIGAFGAAAAGQVTAITEAAEAEKKYQDAIDQHGAASKQATDAQAAYVRQVEKMPAATRTTAAALSAMKDEYRAWSDSLADSTMPVATKAIQTFSATFPKLSPLVEGSSRQLDRFFTIAAGSVASPGLDAFTNKFADFSERAMAKANDSLIQFMRTADSGRVSSGVSTFMDYVRSNGPLVRDTLSSVATTLTNVLAAASNAGPSLLTVVNVFASLAAAVPSGVITQLLQVAIAIKAVRLAAAGMAAVSGRVVAFGASLTAMRLAASGATGVVPKLTAALGALSSGARLGLAAGAIGALVVAMHELSDQKAPVAVDELSTSLNTLAATGKVTGALKSNFDEISESIAIVSKSASDNKFVQLTSDFGSWLGVANGPGVSDARKNLDAWDKSMAQLVAEGKPQQAAAQFEILKKAWVAGGGDLDRLKEVTNDYENSLANQKFEADLAAQAMGLFGTQAQATSAKLAEQKKSADGLRQAIQALSEQHRNAFDSETKFEAAIDAVTQSLKDNGATLDVGTEKGRANRDALSQLAGATEDAAAKARENNASWQAVAGIYDKGRKSLVDNIMAMGKSRTEAEALAATLLTMPSPKMRLEMRTEDAVRSLNDVISAMKAAPGKKEVKVEALTSDAIAMLRELGLTVEKTPDGSFKITAETQSAKDALANVQRARDGLKDKSISLSARDKASKAIKDIRAAIASLRDRTVNIYTVQHTLGVEGTAGRNNAKYNGYASGGTPVEGETAIVGEQGPELVTFGSDARVFDAATTRKMLAGVSGAGRDVTRGLAAGMSAGVGGVAAAAAMMASAVTLGVRQELQIASPSRVMKALAKDVGRGFISGLTGSRDKIKSVSKDLASDVRAAFSGNKESALIGLINKDTKKLLDAASKRDALEKKIAEANKFASDTANQARATGSLSTIVQEDAYSPKYVKGQMAASLKQIKQFTANVKTLQKKGLNKDLLRQILEMGPEQGAAFAASLAGADKATIKQYNSLNSQISKESSKLGKYGADLLYDSGKKAGDGFLTGLKAQKKQIEKFMLDLAKSMQAAIKKALGIKSPSRVMEAVGHMTMAGLEGGLVRRVPAVQGVMRKVATAVATGVPDARGIAAGAVSTSRRGASGAGATVHEHHYHFDNNGVIGSQIELDNWLARSIDRLNTQHRLPKPRVA